MASWVELAEKSSETSACGFLGFSELGSPSQIDFWYNHEALTLPQSPCGATTPKFRGWWLVGVGGILRES